jgi:hypothetical protein
VDQKTFKKTSGYPIVGDEKFSRKPAALKEPAHAHGQEECVQLVQPKKLQSYSGIVSRIKDM